MGDRFNIFRFDHRWFVSLDDQIDQQLTRAVNKSLSRLSRACEQSNITFLQQFLNFKLPSDDKPDALIAEDFASGRERITAFLENQGFEVLPSDREDFADWVNPGSGRNFGRLSMHLSSLHRVYRDLADQGLRSKVLPTHVDDFREWSTTEKNARKIAIYGNDAAERVKYSGMQYVMANLPSYAIRIEDPRELKALMISAARADDWCASAFALLNVIGDAGARFADAAPTTALDWWLGSRFGDIIECPLKGSKGERRGRLRLSPATRRSLIENFDADPRRPNFCELQAMASGGLADSLNEIFLFPSAGQCPFSSHTFINDYVRPTMERHAVRIRSRCGLISSIATLHRLRAASIQCAVERAFHVFEKRGFDDRSRIRLAEEINAISRDHHIYSKKAFARYLGEIVAEFAKKGLRERSDRRTAAIDDQTIFDGLVHHNGQASVAQQRAASL
ncbi:hypothetical protein E3U23_07515 [Erythrobacter litoralis]|uniref:hypothetical protein n=1 Tax=Erythrobacter litoralis TaxID=39960 RepID=UPI002435727E|nr:hypothetical protein [Erythrobacter litoralis]MDG6079038.1 hypothetical protein [Erythrobacter litoralis]